MCCFRCEQASELRLAVQKSCVGSVLHADPCGGRDRRTIGHVPVVTVHIPLSEVYLPVARNQRSNLLSCVSHLAGIVVVPVRKGVTAAEN